MIEDLLQTKLYIPSLRPSLVPRPRLVEKLNQGIQSGCKITLVSAPAGFGKTTLITDWGSQIAESVNSQAAFGVPQLCWLSLDEGDNDPARFLIYLIAALRSANEDIGETALSLLQSPQSPPSEIVLTTLINDVVLAAMPIILVLDDYHVIHTPPIHQQLGFLLDHLPPQLHLVILTREDPLLPIGRLRARGQLLEIHQDDLRFNLEEITHFLHHTMAFDLPPQDISALARRTEGWIAGLQLAALSMQGRDDLAGFIQAFTGSNRFILDYLIEEVFEQQSPEVKEFLIKTSILERLSAPLCNAVVEKTASQELLEALEQANLFIVPLDQSRGWYRYHRLFAELLRHRLRLSQPDIEAELHLRASLWFEAENLTAEAIQYALAAQNWPRAAQLINQVAERMLRRGEVATLVDWYQRVPEELIRSQPDFGLSYVWALLLLGRLEAAEELLTYFEEIGQSVPVLLGQVATAQAYAARSRGDNQRVIEKSEQALVLLPESEVISRSTLSLNLGLVYWHEGQLRQAVPALNEARTLALQTKNHYGSLTAQIFLARTLASQGALRQAEAMLLKTLQAGGQIPILVLAHYDLAGIYYEWNNLTKGRSHLQQGLDDSTQSRNVEFQNAGHILKACLLMAQGNMLDALAEVETSHALAQNLNLNTQARSMACHAFVALAMDDISTAEQWVRQTAVEIDVNSFYRFLGLTKVRLLLAQGDKVAAREILEERLARATEAGWGYATIAIYVLQALAAESEEAALEILAETLPLSQPEGFIRTYVDAGAGLIPLLQESARRGILPDYVGQILSAFGPGKKSTMPLVEPLSERELEVLRLVAAGMSNREIAEKLFISTGTAKTHVHNVCGKLGTRNRTEAATRAKELGLV